MKEFIPNELPLEIPISENMYKLLVTASRALSELRGIARTIPNRFILINALVLQEAKDSSEIENIITTHDELFLSQVDKSKMAKATKEVQDYGKALQIGFWLISRDRLFRNSHILAIQKRLERNDAGFRRQSGTMLKNPSTGEIKHIPPQHYEDIVRLMSNLEQYINDDSMQDLDPLIKMAIIHYQFESIHPFYDGNGRSGRIINILYLVYKGLLDLPILYLSGYIVRHKAEYYELLQKVRDENAWEEWISYILKGVEYLRENPFIGDMYEGELLEKLSEVETKYLIDYIDEINNILSNALIKNQDYEWIDDNERKEFEELIKKFSDRIRDFQI